MGLRFTDLPLPPGRRRAVLEEGDGSEGEDPVAHRYVLGVDIPLELTDPVGEGELYVDRVALRAIEGIGPELGASIRKLSLVATSLPSMGDGSALLNCTQLEELDLYQNAIPRIKHLQHLGPTLVRLDLGYNKIRQIEGLEHLVNLRDLVLTSNRIKKMEGLGTLTRLEKLELGANRLRVVEGLEGCAGTLRELWLGKQKITEMDLGCALPRLTHLGLQSNRLEQWSQALGEQAPALRFLYLGHNNLPSTGLDAALAPLPSLEELDLAGNPLTTMPLLEQARGLRELWLNDCKVRTSNPKPLALTTCLRSTALTQ